MWGELWLYNWRVQVDAWQKFHAALLLRLWGFRDGKEDAPHS